MIPVLGKLKLFLTDKELIIPQGSLYIINSQEIHGMHHTEDTDIYKGYALQINYDFIKKYYPAIDNYQFIQPNHKIKEKILLDIFKIIAAYDHSNQFQRIEIESYILHLLYTLLSNTLDKKTNLNLQTLHDKRIIRRRCGQFLGPKGTRRRKTWHIRNKKKNELSPYMMN